MNKRKSSFVGVGRKPTTDRHGKKRWRLRRTIKGRKVDTYLPGPFGSDAFIAAYDAACNPATCPKTKGDHGTFDHVISHYRGSKKYLTETAASTRYSKGKRLDWICDQIGTARLVDLMPYHVEHLMDQKGGPDAANRLLKEISEMFDHGRKKMGLNISNPIQGIEKRKSRIGGYHTWTAEEVEQFRKHHSTGSKARLALELMLATGAARQDACAMGRQNIKGDVIYYRRGKGNRGQPGQDTELPMKYMPALVAEIRRLAPGTTTFLTHGNGQTYTKESFGNWFADQCKGAGLPDRCRAHGLRKHGATELAEAGANEFQIMSFLAHKSTKEALTYVKEAQRKKMAADGMAKAHEAKLSNLSDWLDKPNLQQTDKKG